MKKDTHVLWTKNRKHDGKRRLPDAWEPYATMTTHHGYKNWYSAEEWLKEMAAHFVPKWQVLPAGRKPR